MNIKFLTNRFFAFLIDLAITGLFGATVMLVFQFIGSYDFSFQLSLILFLAKDLYNENGSFGKNFFDLKIKYSGEYQEQFYFLKILRNFTLLIYPIEIIVLLTFNGKRIGDLLFNTTVVKV